MRGAGLKQLVDDKIESYPMRGAVNSNRLLRDRDGGLWIGTRIGDSSTYIRTAQTYFRDRMASPATSSLVFSRIVKVMFGPLQMEDSTGSASLPCPRFP